MDSAAGSIGPSTFVEADRTRNHRFPRWSHDGRQLMWVTSRAPRWELSVRELTTGKVTTAALDLGYIWTFDWSPDGSIVVFRAERNGSTGLHLVDVRSGAARTLAVQTPTRGLYHPRFTADGSAMTVVRAEGPRDQTRQWSYVAVDVKSGEQRVLRSDLAELMAGSGTHPMTPSPDGRYLLSMTYPGPPSIIRVLETANGQVRDLLRGDRSQAFNHDGYVQWLPGGNAFLTTMRGASRQELWLVPVDGGKPRLIDLASTRFSSDLHALRPDGREVAFVTAPQPPGGLSGLRILEGLLRTIR
jgi:Tol biopolymer transport system component